MYICTYVYIYISYSVCVCMYIYIYLQICQDQTEIGCLFPLVIIIFIAKGKCVGELCLSSLLLLMVAESRISMNFKIIPESDETRWLP